MSASITSSLCVLCRRPLDAEDAGSASRLCDNCRKMVDNIRPPAPRPAAGPASKVTVQEAAPMTQIQTPPETSSSGLGGKLPLQTGANGDAPSQSAADSAYHQNWPIMVEEAPDKKRGKGFLTLLLLVGLAVSAGGAIILFKDKVFGSHGGLAAASSPSSPNQTAAEEPKARRPGPSSLPAGGRMFSLQAASFPSEESAKQYQDKLAHAGLPAYVVAADIPHRGKWYRVRAGKFASREEARRAAESWRKRAAAAGMNLQLVACEYP